MPDRLFQARVDAYAATRLRAYAQAKPKKKMSESELVKYALDLVIDEADRQLAALQQKKVLADANRTAQALGGDGRANTARHCGSARTPKCPQEAKPSKPRSRKQRRCG